MVVAVSSDFSQSFEMTETVRLSSRPAGEILPVGAVSADFSQPFEMTGIVCLSPRPAGEILLLGAVSSDFSHPFEMAEIVRLSSRPAGEILLLGAVFRFLTSARNDRNCSFVISISGRDLAGWCCLQISHSHSK